MIATVYNVYISILIILCTYSYVHTCNITMIIILSYCIHTYIRMIRQLPSYCMRIYTHIHLYTCIHVSRQLRHLQGAGGGEAQAAAEGMGETGEEAQGAQG